MHTDSTVPRSTEMLLVSLMSVLAPIQLISLALGVLLAKYSISDLWVLFFFIGMPCLFVQAGLLLWLCVAKIFKSTYAHLSKSADPSEFTWARATAPGVISIAGSAGLFWFYHA